MDGIHDIGGMDGFTDLPPDESDEASPFHEPWEGRVYALFVAGIASGAFNLDEFRYAIERLDPEFYLESTYYERWLAAVETLLVESGSVERSELESRVEAFEAGEASVPKASSPGIDELTAGVAETYQSGRDTVEPAFSVGDEVQVCKRHPRGHTRCPRYVRGARGTVQAHHGTHVLPDASARGEDRAEPLYNVRFDAADLWGPEHTDADGVRIELWESYLEGVDR